MIQQLLAVIAAAKGPRFTLSGAAIAEVLGPNPSLAQLIVRTDGTIDEYTSSGGTVQLSSATDWVIPNAAANSTYEVRVQSSPPGDPFDTSPAADGTWVDLSTDRTWGLSDPTGGSSKDTGNFTLELRKNGGSVLASGTYSLSAEAL